VVNGTAINAVYYNITGTTVSTWSLVHLLPTDTFNAELIVSNTTNSVITVPNTNNYFYSILVQPTV